jgi:hypothetical protein
MKRLHLTALALMAAALAASAEERRATAFSSSSSTNSTSYTDGSGNTITTTTTEQDGKRETRRTVTGPDGKIISETNGEDEAKPGAKPAAEEGKAGGPWLGVHAAELPPAMREQLDLPAGTGLLIEQLPPDSPAANAGIAQHDILLTINLTPVGTPGQLRDELAKHRPGEKVLVEYLHKSRREKAAVTLGKRANPQGENKAPQAAAPKGNTGDAFPGGTGKTAAKSSTRTVIVGPDGKAKVIETEGPGDPFASMLRDPNVPETMRESLRKMQQQMHDFQKRTEGVAPGNTKPAGEDSQ